MLLTHILKLARSQDWSLLKLLRCKTRDWRGISKHLLLYRIGLASSWGWHLIILVISVLIVRVNLLVKSVRLHVSCCILMVTTFSWVWSILHFVMHHCLPSLVLLSINNIDWLYKLGHILLCFSESRLVLRVDRLGYVLLVWWC
jgi:hypothetical protein